jgi:hypothetical protein
MQHLQLNETIASHWVGRINCLQIFTLAPRSTQSNSGTTNKAFQSSLTFCQSGKTHLRALQAKQILQFPNPILITDLV